MDASDILDDLQILLPQAKAINAPARLLPELSESERSVYDAIDSSETAIDSIAAKCNLPSGAVSSTLLSLELKRLVKQLPGKYFVKLA
jgi:DNA processing protein